ncbi:hypothetical protein QYM36_011111, partial [Artemia franciscana]
LKVVFPDYKSSIVGFESTETQKRTVNSEVSLNFILTADVELTEDDIIALLKRFQTNEDEATVPGISFSALLDPSLLL